MANTKKISALYNVSGATLYCIVRRVIDGYYLNDNDGDFAEAPVDKYIALTESAILKGVYELSESRKVWNDGTYSIFIYKQLGASPNLVNDDLISGGDMEIESDSEKTLGIVPTASEVSDSVHDEIIESTFSLRKLLRIFLAVFAGKSSGGGTAAITFRDVADGKNRVSATVDTNGNRLSITLDGD